MNALIADDCPKMISTPSTRSTATSGVIHHSLRRQKKVRSPPAIPTRADVLRTKRRIILTGDSPGKRDGNGLTDAILASRIAFGQLAPRGARRVAYNGSREHHATAPAVGPPGPAVQWDPP